MSAADNLLPRYNFYNAACKDCAAKQTRPRSRGIPMPAEISTAITGAKWSERRWFRAGPQRGGEI